MLRFRSSSLLLLALVATSAAACGDDSSTDSGSGATEGAGAGSSSDTGSGSGGDSATGSGGDSATGSGPGSGTGGDATSSASSADTSSSSGTGGEGPAPANVGFIGFINSEVDTEVGEFLSGYASAQFYAVDDVQAGACTSAESGACTFYHCESSNEPGPPVPYVSAGELSVTGAAVPVTLGRDESNIYSFTSDDALVYAPGATLTTTATGDTAPAFTIAVVAPGHATITSPSFDAPVIDRGEDLEVAWDGTGEGTLEINLGVGVTEGDLSVSDAVQCSFPLSDGVGSIPSSLLQMIPASAAGYMTAGESNREQRDEGDYRIFAYATQTASADGLNGLATAGDVTFE